MEGGLFGIEEGLRGVKGGLGGEKVWFFWLVVAVGKGESWEGGRVYRNAICFDFLASAGYACRHLVHNEPAILLR